MIKALKTSFIYLISLFFFVSGCKKDHQQQEEICCDLGIHTIQDKIWAHRVNVVSNNKVKFKKFKGIEIDVFYEPKEKLFYVKHDLEDSGTELSLFLDSALSIAKVPIWIDYKNMNIETEQGVLQMQKILQSKGILKNCFIESYYLSAIQKAKGKLLTSFWKSTNPLPVSKLAQDSLYQKEYKDFNTEDFNMFSAPHTMFEFYSYYFPEKKCNYWISGKLSEKEKKRLLKIAQTKNTNIVLIDGDTNYLYEEFSK